MFVLLGLDPLEHEFCFWATRALIIGVKFHGEGYSASSLLRGCDVTSYTTCCYIHQWVIYRTHKRERYRTS